MVLLGRYWCILRLNQNHRCFSYFSPNCFSPKAPFNYPCALQCVQHNWKYFLRLFVIFPSFLAKGDRKTEPSKTERAKEKHTERERRRIKQKCWEILSSLLQCFGSAVQPFPLLGEGRVRRPWKSNTAGMIHLPRLGSCVWPAEGRQAGFRQGASFGLSRGPKI